MGDILTIPAALPDIWRTRLREDDWRMLCAAHLRKELREHPFANPSAPHIGFYGIQPGNVAAVVVYDTNWTLHIQGTLRGQEQRDPEYGLTPECALVSLDVEIGPRERFDQASLYGIDFVGLRRAIKDAIIPATGHLGGAAKVSEQKGTKEHLVWEVLPFAEQKAEDIERVADRLAIYTRVLLPTATEALTRWAHDNRIVMEVLP